MRKATSGGGLSCKTLMDQCVGCERVCGMNFQNFFWRIESLYQRTLIRIQYKFLCQILMIFGFSLNVWSRAIFDNLVAQPGAFGKNMSAPGPKSSYLHLCYSVGPIPNKLSRVYWNSSISILQMNWNSSQILSLSVSDLKRALQKFWQLGTIEFELLLFCKYKYVNQQHHN